eukprot:5738786-Pyramimonas_sp.AAC.1
MSTFARFVAGFARFMVSGPCRHIFYMFWAPIAAPLAKFACVFMPQAYTPKHCFPRYLGGA